MAKIEKEMTLEQALNILKDGSLAHSEAELENAVQVIREKDPNNQILKEFLHKTATFKKENNLEEDNPEVYASNSKTLETFSKSYSFAAFTKQKDNADIAGYIDNTELYLHDDEKNPVSDEQIRKNYLKLLFENAKLKAQTALSGSVSFLKSDKEEQSRTFKETVKDIFFVDFARAAVASVLDKPKNEEQRIGSEDYRRYIRKQSEKASEFFANILQGGKKIRMKADSILASCAESAVHVENYIAALRHKAKSCIADKVKTGTETAQNVFNKLADKFQKKKNSLETMANTISKNRYEIFKNIKGSFSDNKFKLIGNVAANAAFGYWTAAAAAGTVAAGAAAAPVLVPALAAYAAYHAAGAWVFPIVAEMRKINRKRKEAGDKPLKFREQLKQAWKNKMSKPKDKRSYIIGGVLNTGLAVAGFAWLKDGVEAADNVRTLTEGVQEGLNVTLAANIAETKHAISIGRTAIPTVAQLTNAGVSYAAHVKDPDNKAKAAEFKQDATAALIGTGLNVLFQGIGFAHGGHTASEDLASLATFGESHTEILPDGTTEHTVDSTGGRTFFGDIFSRKNDTEILPDSTTGHTADSTGIKAFFGRLFSHKSDADMSVADSPAPVYSPDSATVSDLDVHTGGDTTGGEIIGETQTVGDQGLFPKAFTSKEEMGITRRQFNTLVQTTEGTLKSASGEEVTLDRAYLNLSTAMDNFPGKTKEEVLYKFNRLYAFMRRAYDVGDGTLRETPSGREYLESRFENMHIPDMTEEKMSQLVTFSMENTYADKADLREGLKDIFPEGLDKKAMNSLVTTIQSNQRFHQYQEEMESLIGLLGCGKEISDEQAAKINILLNKTDEILGTGRSNVVLTGVSLNHGCHDDDGEWRRIGGEVAVADTPKEEAPLPELPELSTDIDIPEEPIEIQEEFPELEDRELSVQPMSVPAPKNNPMGVTRVTTDNLDDLEEGTGLRRRLGQSRADRMLKRAGIGERD